LLRWTALEIEGAASERARFAFSPARLARSRCENLPPGNAAAFEAALQAGELRGQLQSRN